MASLRKVLCRLRRLRRRDQGIVSIEVALIFPVLLFILVMFFELARIALVITVVNISLERAGQNFRQMEDYYALGESRISTIIQQRVVDYSLGLVSAANVKLNMHSFASLGEFSGSASSSDSSDDDAESYTNAPVFNLTLTVQQNFMTPLPALFGLGHSYQHEFSQVLGDLVISDEDEDE